ncbi:nucleotide exchange factor GrpE [Labilibaculum sp. A4]|uniref:nucleotide exchange factor GrpE n=1 Tax=Labilibaculum euxinus TaxID=2686357 RepID=UPI000F619D97|nr:nucleotide exchange factor GrpE [Labilibaculum euxinus]MDQ1769765.1 nucleotide exchange factor GrpE [Labilibaculum euxinus]MWN76323.1 nucleotide exchange factor GrpE [Labilibaculum euxinus]|eukprot:TRINITY_DN17506_c0_g1_i1.p2 TRINITY_DN17506_c0_g1~~TRINITY_DN17506_c0_g1_i1.p2  ORF type:complete len:205 (-),score=36.28 TRINITY_DN17506_c0_g1_i1:1250-1864(-)
MTKDKSKSNKEELKDKDIETTENQTVEETCKKEESKIEENKDTKKTKKSSKEKKADELAELTIQLQEISDKYVRLSAEFDNYRKRTLKEKMELTKSGGEKILINILPVMDNFERALQSIDAAKDIDAIKDGVHLIYGNFKEFVTQNGIKEIEAVNQAFDTDIHEAITKIPAPTKELKGKVVDCVEKGYFLHDKVIRFAKVVVGE